MKSTENIWHEYHLKLTTFIRSKVAEDVVDDLLQDVFLKIHTRIDSLKENTKLESWLYQITRIISLNYWLQIELRDNLRNKTSKMVFWQPILD